jgi:ATP-binding cassette subfamily B protein
MALEQPPLSVLKLLDTAAFGDRTDAFFASTDVTLEGRCGRQWLAVKGRHLTVVGGTVPPTILFSHNVEEVECFRADGAVGSGFLQARVGGVWVDLLRYSNALSARFARVAADLEELRTAGRLPEHGDLPDRRRCTACGLALAFEGDTCPRCIDRGALAAQIWRFMRPYRRMTLVTCLLILVGVLAELAPPKLQEYLVDNVLRFGGEGTRAGDLLGVLAALVGGLAFTRLLLAAVNSGKGVIASRVGTMLTADLRARLVERLEKLPVDYYDRHPVGVLMSRVTHDTEALYGLIHQLTGGFLLQVLQLLGVGVMLFLLNPKLALWTLLPAPFVLYGSWFFWRYVYPKYQRYWDAASKQAASLAGVLTGIRVVKAFAQEDHEFRKFQGASEALRQSRSRVEVAAATFSAVMQTVFSLGGLIVWYVGGRDVLRGQMTLGALMAFLAYLAMFYAPLTALAQFTTWLTRFLTASHRVFELLETPIGVAEPADPAPLPKMRGLIQFEGVTFGYDHKQPLLKDFHLEIRPGELVGVVGRSGSGKTTLVNLISRFYDVDGGRLTIDGIDVRKIAREDLRSQIGVVLQEPFLFRGTVWENLVYGRPSARVEEALAAAKGANAHDFIMRLPFGYDTPLGERGAGLSGGERQRLSIARALLYDPKVLILDEATSSVDTESEKAIQEALAVLARGRTTIAISHRLSTLRNADRILVLEGGKLVEQGTHQDLLDAGGPYAKLVRFQTQLTADAALDGSAEQDQQARPRAQAANPSKNGECSPPSTAGNGRSPKANRAREETTIESLALHWLTPDTARIERGDYNTMRVIFGGRAHGGVFAVQPLPATRPGQFVSVRYADAEGHQHEVGFVRDVTGWPEPARTILKQALGRRYFVRVITAIEGMRLAHGLLTFRVRTDRGPAEFVLRYGHGQVLDHGRTSKLLIDVEDNRFLIEDVDALTRPEQTLFRRFIYW